MFDGIGEYTMNEYGIFDIKKHYEEKKELKIRRLNEYTSIIQDGNTLNEKQYKEREVLLAEISLIKLFLDDIDYIIEKYAIK